MEGRILAWAVAALVVAAQLACSVEAQTFFQNNFDMIGSTWMGQEYPNHTVALSKDQYGNAAFISKHKFFHGVFNVKIKLPGQYAAGIVSTIYMSSVTDQSGPRQQAVRDEIDWEFLGNVHPRGTLMATNYYANGQGQDTHEEGFYMWFDPAKEFHTYSIVWGWRRVVWMVDYIPIRIEYRQKGSAWNDYNFVAKPMYLRASIWDGSAWATDGGALPANYSYGPYTTQFARIHLRNACTYVKPGDGQHHRCLRGNYKGPWDLPLSAKQISLMHEYRSKYLKYSNVLHCGNRTEAPCN